MKIHMKNEGGFTMVEMVVTVALAAIVATMLLNFLDQSTRLTGRAARDVETEQEAQLTLRRMTEDVRAATGIQQCPSGGYSTCLTFNIPRSATAGATCPERRLTYALVGTAIQETRLDYPANCGAPTTKMSAKPIITSVKNGASTAVFTYYDKSHNAIDPVNAAASVPQAASIVVSLQLSFTGGGSVVLNLSSTAALRNNR